MRNSNIGAAVSHLFFRNSTIFCNLLNFKSSKFVALIQNNGTGFFLRECISCPRQCDVSDGWHPRLLRHVPIKQMAQFTEKTEDVPVCSKQFGRFNPEDRLNASEAFDFCFKLGCKNIFFELFF